MKHAYLIIAHGYFEQLEFLIKLLEHPNNTIFILIDDKVNFSQLQEDKIKKNVKNSEIIFIDRLSIYWGDYSLVRAMMQLFIAAYNHDNYQFFHVLSGQDLPLKRIDLINQFFENYPDKNFITLVDEKIKIKNNIDDRVRYYYFLSRYAKGIPSLKNKIINKVNKIIIYIQKILKINRLKNKDIEIMYGSNWVSLNRETVKLLKNNEKWIQDTFSYTFIPDELFIPTLLKKYKLLNTIYYRKGVTDKPYEIQGNLRYINWWDGNPYLWTSEDIQHLDKCRQNHFFARKFDLSKDLKLKEYINKINKKEY